MVYITKLFKRFPRIQIGLSLLLAFAILTASLAVVTVAFADSQKVWGGRSDVSAPIDDDGDGIYEITTGAELAYVVKNGGEGKEYILTDDIYLNDVSKVNWSTGVADNYTPNRWYAYWEIPAFSGNIDGDGHTVYGLYEEQNPGSYATGGYGIALIPYVDTNTSVTVRNLGIDCAYLHYEGAVASFIGDLKNGATATFDSCYSGKNVYLKGANAGAFCGRTGSESTVTVSNCYSLSTAVVSDGFIAGIAGVPRGNTSIITIKNSFNANGPIFSSYYTNHRTVENSYQTSSDTVYSEEIRTSENMQGKDVFSSDSKMPNLNADNCFKAQTGYPILTVFESLLEEEVVPEPVDPRAWDGTESAPVDSDNNGVFEITNASELAYVIKNGGDGKHYKLTDDIYLNDINKVNWADGTVEAGYNVQTWYDANNSVRFRGSIDGAGNTVYGLYHKGVNTTFTEYVPYSIGLIPYVDSNATVEIKNLGVDNTYIWYECFASAFVGSAGTNGAPSSVIFENCYVGEKVHIIGHSAAAFRGYTFDGPTVIKNCYSMAELTANGGYSGFTAKVWGELEITNSYNTNGPLLSDPERYKVTIKNSYQTQNGGTEDGGAVTLSKENMQGEDVFENPVKMPKLNEDNVYIAGESYPVNYVFTDSFVNEDDTPVNTGIWDGSIAQSLSGKGTEEEPYIISNGAELAFAVTNGGKGAYYKLTDDIYLNDIDKVDWSTGKTTTVGYRINSWYYNIPFEGVIDGNGHTVYGLYFKTDLEEKEFFWGRYGVGLIPRVDDGKSLTVSKIGIDNVFVSFECGSSALIGYTGAGAKVKIDQCYVGKNATVKGYSAGALRGATDEANLVVSNCYSLADISAYGEGSAYGLVANVWGPMTIRNSYNGKGPISSYYERYNVIFEDCYQTKTGADGETGVKTISASNMQGRDVFKNKAKMSGLNKYEAYILTDSYPTLSVFSGGKGAISFTDEGVKGRVWSGKIASDFAGGKGTKNDPYLIETPEQLALLITGGSGDGDNYYKLTADIKLNDTTKSGWEKNARQWYAGMNVFRGVFDGNGHVVSGLYYNAEMNNGGYAAGLFQRLGADSEIKRVGVTRSKIVAKNKDGVAIAAAIVGWTEDWDPKGNPNKTAPKISQCFADDSVYVEGTSAGGIVGGVPTLVIVENCYFTGELTGRNFSGAIVGDAWAGDGYGPKLISCYASTLDRNAIGGGDAFAAKAIESKKTVMKNVYVDGIDLSGGANLLSVMFMRGDSAKQKMEGFDFTKIWSTVKDGSPVLSCFINSDKYSSRREPKKVKISFANMGNEKLDDIYGIPGYTRITAETIPTPYRYGYTFIGWHHFNEYGADFKLDVFPDFDITLFAQWEQVGFTVGFEGELDDRYDYNSGIEVHRPGIEGYQPKFIRSGWATLHAKADSKVEPTFLVSYENALENGKEYHITVWLSTDTENTSGKLKLIHTEHPDVNDRTIGQQTLFEYTGLQVGEWMQFEATFIANGPYILISSPVGQSLYFDDIRVVPTGSDGELGNIEISENIFANEPLEEEESFKIDLILIISAVFIILVAGAVATALIIRKRKHSK